MEILHKINGLLFLLIDRYGYIFNLIKPQRHNDSSIRKAFTSSKAIPQCSIGYPSFIGKWGSTSLCVIVGHSGMGICIYPSQLPKDLHTGNDFVMQNKFVQELRLQQSEEHTFTHLFIWCGWVHPFFLGVFREVKGVWDHQFSSMQTGRYNKRIGSYPLHYSICLWCNYLKINK